MIWILIQKKKKHISEMIWKSKILFYKDHNVQSDVVNLCTRDILARITLLWNLSCASWDVSSGPGLYPVDARNIPQLWQPKMANVPWVAKSPATENCCVKYINIMNTSRPGVLNPWATDRYWSVACQEPGCTAGGKQQAREQSSSVFVAAPQH